MFDWLKNIFGGGNKTSNTPSRPQSQPQRSSYDPAAEQRKREEEERRRAAETARKNEEAAYLRKVNAENAERQAGEERFNRMMQKQKTDEQKQQELEDLTKENLDTARQNQKKGRGFFATVADALAGDASEQRAQVEARNKATSQYQDKYGWNKDKAVISFGNRTLQKANEGSDNAKKSIDNTKKTVDVIRYLPGAGLGELGANALRGNFSGSDEADNTLLREQMDLNDAQIKELSDEDRGKYLAFAKGGLGAGVLDVVGVGAGGLAKNVAKGGFKNAIKSNAKSSLKQVGKDFATKQGAKSLVKNISVGAGVGAGIGGGGAKALGADDEAALEAAARGAFGGAFGGAASSPFDIATTSLARGNAAKTAVRGALEKGDATTIVDAGMKTAQNSDKATIPTMTPVDPAVDGGNKIEVSPGVMIEDKTKPAKGDVNDPIEVNDNTPAFVRKRAEAEQQAAVQAEADAAVAQADPTFNDPSIDDIPAFQRNGTVLESEKVDIARAEELRQSDIAQAADLKDADMKRGKMLKQQVEAMPSAEQIRSSEFELRSKFAKDVQARPDLRFKLQQKLNENLSQLKRATEDSTALKQELEDVEVRIKNDDYVTPSNELNALDTKLGGAYQQRKMAQALAEVEKNTPSPAKNEVQIPDVTNPIALAKGDPDGVPIAQFRDSVDGSAPLAKAEPVAEPAPEPLPPTVEPTQTDIADAAAQGDLRIPTRTQADNTAEGNQPLESDVAAQQALADEGLAPNRGDSPVALADEAEQTARAEDVSREVAGQTNAPNTREQAVNRLSDEETRTDLMQNAPRKDTVNLEEAEYEAKAQLNNMDDGEIVTRYSDGVKVDDPVSFYKALNAVKRLERIDSPEAQVSIRNAIDSMADYAAESGRGLRTVQVLFDDMPATMKVDYLTRKLSKAGADLTDPDRAQLAGFIQAADNATASVRQLEDRARLLLEDGSIRNGEVTPEIQAQIRQLSDDIQKAELNKEAVSGEAFRDYQRHLDGEVPIGKKAGDIGRTLMLSAPSGRLFDVASTTATAADDILNRGVSNLIGKGYNAVKGAGSVQSTLANPRQLVKGVKEGAQRVARSFKGEDFVEDFLGEAKRSTRGDINTGGGVVRRTVRAAVETPTNLTRGLRTDQLYREGMQEAAKQGLKGDAQKAYAEVRSLVPTNKQLDAGVDAQMRANMLHENGASRFLNNIARSLDSNKALGGIGAPLIRNQIAPFTSWLGGNLNRTFTDKNVIHNAAKIIDGARKNDPQMVIDNVAKLGVNTAQTYAVGALLTQAGIITTEDANGDDYGGLYFHIGDRYFPVAIAGTMSVPLILGNAFEQSAQAAQEDGSGASEFANSLVVNLLKNAGVASVFGGENNLQSTVSALADGSVDVADTGVKYVGDFVRQYIPSLTGDINSFVDMTSLNPTGEAAKTKVLTADETDNGNKQDSLKTQFNKTLARIPGLSQGLEREEGKNAQDPLDRILKGNRENASTAEKRENAKALEDVEKQYAKDGIPTKDDDIRAFADEGDYDKAIAGAKYRLAKLQSDENSSKGSIKSVKEQIEKYGLEKDGIPTTEEGVKARMEDGDYERVAKGLEYKYSKLKDDNNVAASTKKELKQSIDRVKVYRDSKLTPDVVTAYESTATADGGVGVTLWREMMNSGDPEQVAYAEKLAALDEKLVKDKLADKAKYYWGKGGRGGGRGGSRGGGGSTKEPKLVTDIATNKQTFSAKPLQKIATGKTPKTVIPKVELVKNYDMSKLKKIKVSKGAQG